MSTAVRRAATCHPERQAAARGLCLVCYRGARERGEQMTKRFGLIGLGERPPARIAGVEQRAVPEDDVPSRCPKCGNVHLVMAGRYLSCQGYLGGCGWDAFVVSPSAQAR